MSRHLALVLLCLLALAPARRPAAQAIVLPGDHVIDGRLCVGSDCVAGEGFSRGPFMIKENNTRIAFVDTTSTADYPTRDWTIVINDSFQNGQDYFGVLDVEGNGIVFRILRDAPQNALVVSGSGRIGIGTALPESSLHIRSSNNAALQLEADAFGSGTDSWKLHIIPTGDLGLSNNHSGTPVLVSKDAASLLLRLAGDRVGIGGDYPLAKLHIDLDSSDPSYPYGLLISDNDTPAEDPPAAMAHIHGHNGQARLRIEEDGAPAAPRSLLELVNNGRPEIVLANTDTGGEWSFGAGTNFILKQGPVGSTSAAKTTRMLIRGANGDVEIPGQIVTGGPTCASGCDAVFDADYPLPAPADHARRMFALGHLPALGPTVPGAPMNLSEKLGGVINELEHAHIYIARLDVENAALRSELARLSARLDALAAARD
ncbi:MAG: hypothetical protein R3D85_17260 [Paracoccaceae bacterium]